MADSGNGLKDRIPPSKAFLQRARMDLESASDDLEAGRFPNACYMAEQASEKAVKALLILNERFEAQHEVSSFLSSTLEALEIDAEELVEAVEELEKYWNIPRYPDPMDLGRWNPTEDITKREAEDTVEKAKYILSRIKRMLEEEFNLSLEESVNYK